MMMLFLLHAIMRWRARGLMTRVADLVPAQCELLDIGSGTGHNAERLRQQSGVRVTEVDVVNMSVTGPEPVLFDGHKLPFANRRFDAVMMVYMLHYLDDPASMLREAARVSKGRLIIIQTICSGLLGKVIYRVNELLFGKAAFFAARLAGLIGADRCPLDCRSHFTRKQLLEIASRAGLKPESIRIEKLLGFLPVSRLTCVLSATEEVHPVMDLNRLEKAPMLSIRRLGQAGFRIPLSQVIPTEMNGASWFEKRRLWYSKPVILAAHAYLTLTGLKMRLMTQARWHGHERSLYSQLHYGTPQISSSALFLPRLPGITLEQLLRRSPHLTPGAMESISWASHALLQLHQIRLPHPITGQSHRFSHGDAKVGNVLISLEQKQAFWFDFETCHRDGMTESERHADDLLVFLLSAVAMADAAEVRDLVESVFGGYQHGEVQRIVLNRMMAWHQRSFLRQLAFPDLEESQWDAIELTRRIFC